MFQVGVDRNKYQIHIPLPPKIDPTVTMMQVEEKPDVTYTDVGGCKEQIEKLREVVETPLLHPERFVNLGIEPPKGILLYGPPGTGKTLCARAVANRTDACFIRVIGSELVQKYVGEGARMVRELFEMARTKKVSWVICGLKLQSSPKMVFRISEISHIFVCSFVQRNLFYNYDKIYFHKLIIFV